MKHKRPAALILQAAHLVHYDWFKKIKILCFISGHTHDLIDQEFSIWAIGLL